MRPSLVILGACVALLLLGLLYDRFVPERAQRHLRAWGAAAIGAVFPTGLLLEFLRECPSPPTVAIYLLFAVMIYLTWSLGRSWQEQEDDRKWRQMIADAQESGKPVKQREEQ